MDWAARGKPADHFFQDRHLDAGQIQSHDEQVKQTRAHRAERFITPRACLNSNWKLSNTPHGAQFAIELRVLEQRLTGVTAKREESFPATKQSAIAQGNAE